MSSPSVITATVVAVALRRQSVGWLLYAGIALNGAGQLVRARGWWGLVGAGATGNGPGGAGARAGVDQA